MSKILVTGAAGFVGSNLIEALEARGDEVVSTDIHDAGPGQHYISADIRDEDTMAKAMDGVHTIFHCASVVHTKRNRERDVWSINLDGSRNILSKAQSAGVSKLVYISTASAVYEGRDIENGDETMPYSRVSQAPYADSKIAAEKMILSANGHEGVATCAIRPHVVFGPGDTRFLPAILRRSKAGKLRFGVGWQEKLSDFTYVTNLIDALLAAHASLELGKDDVAGQAFFVTNGEPMPFFDFVKKVLERMDLPAILGSVPYPVAYAVASIVEGLDTLRGGTLGTADGMSRFAVRYMCTHHYFSIDKARRSFGYDPQVNIHNGIEKTVAHLEANGLPAL